jgi:hypothetical protein
MRTPASNDKRAWPALLLARGCARLPLSRQARIVARRAGMTRFQWEGSVGIGPSHRYRSFEPGHFARDGAGVHARRGGRISVDSYSEAGGVADKSRAPRSADAAALDPSGAIAASFSRRMALLSRAIDLAVLSALVTAGFLIGAFVAALEGIGHARQVAMMFAVSLGLLITAQVELTREIRIYMANMHLE